MATATRVATATAVLGLVLYLGLSAPPAGADVIDPPGACSAAGTWTDEGVDRASTQFAPDDVIEIPQRDTVRWSGGIGAADGAAEVARREISGEVQIDIAGVATHTIDSWSGSSVRAANEGRHHYDLPDVLKNVKIRLHGEHREAPEGSAAFTTVCGGSVYLQVTGSTFSNPLSIAALAGMVLSGFGVAWAGMVRRP